MAKDSLEKVVKEMIDRELNVLRRELKEELPRILGSVIGGSVVGAGVNTALEAALSGKKIEARDVANSMARALVPEIRDFFNSSGAQSGESLMALISSAQRNM